MLGQPERILIVIPSPECGGAERQTMQVAQGFARMGAEVSVVADPELIAGLTPLAPGITLHRARIAYDPAREARAMQVGQAAALKPLLHALRPEAALVCLPMPNEAMGAMLALSETDIPTLAVAHLVRRDTVLGMTDQAALARIRAGWAAVSAPAARRLEALFGLPHARVAALPNGLPASTPPPSKPRGGAPVLLAVGRLDERKGALLAPATAAAIAPARLRLAGGGPLAALLERAPGVELLGQRADIAALLAEADAFLLASDHEGCPLSVLEAAMAGCPILATREALEAWPEAEAMARLVRRDARDIAARFAECLSDTEGTARRVTRAREVAAAWDEAAMINRTAWLLAAETAR